MRDVQKVFKVVTVEDSSIIVERVRAILSELREITFSGNASTIRDALELIKTSDPDAVILDINLKTPDGKSGVNLLNILRRVYPEMKIVVLTNFADQHYRLLCKSYGADDFLDKSNEFDKIPETLMRLLQIRRAV